MTATLATKAQPTTADASLNTTFSTDLTQSLLNRMFMPSSGMSKIDGSVSPEDRLTITAGCAPIPSTCGACQARPDNGSCQAR